jgi:hypothetical protein
MNLSLSFYTLTEAFKTTLKMVLMDIIKIQNEHYFYNLGHQKSTAKVNSQ